MSHSAIGAFPAAIILIEATSSATPQPGFGALLAFVAIAIALAIARRKRRRYQNES